MTTREPMPAPLADLLRDQQEEIGKHKWIESEKAGHDIGWVQAREDWFHNHLADWLRHQRRIVDQVLLTAELRTAPPAGPVAATTGRDLPVLVVDDNQYDRELISIHLGQAWPFERDPLIETATNGLEALDKIRARPFGLILLDWNMPVGGSGHVLRRLRQQRVFIPVVVVSGLDREELAGELDALRVAYLSKNDLSADSLTAAIAEALRRVGVPPRPSRLDHVHR